jgi:hypothetical protein
VKQSEAARIPALLAARQPRPVWEEANIEGIHMLIIIGNEVDTVIRYIRNGGADMPQLSSYPEVAESAAHADERLAKQRASGRANTTGEGFHWPRNWKLSAAKDAGKIWYAASRDRVGANPATAGLPVRSRVRPVVPPVPVALVGLDADASAIPRGTWRWCAEDYFTQLWWPQDRKLMLEFSENVTCEILHNLCVLYRVARTIPGYGIAKYRPFVDMLNRHRGTAMTRENAPSIIEEELSNMRRAYGKNFLSAITKALWMMKQHPIAIYDSYAWEGLRRRGLAPGYEGYRAYYKAWFRFFEEPDTQSGLNDALSWLPESAFVKSLLKAGLLVDSELKSLAGSMWFRNRVADRRLCFDGGVVEFK